MAYHGAKLNLQKFIALTIIPCQFKINKKTSTFVLRAYKSLIDLIGGPSDELISVIFFLCSVTKSNYRFVVESNTRFFNAGSVYIKYIRLQRNQTRTAATLNKRTPFERAKKKEREGERAKKKNY